jgi:hypothetical protein
MFNTSYYENLIGQITSIGSASQGVLFLDDAGDRCDATLLMERIFMQGNHTEYGPPDHALPLKSLARLL